MIAMALACRPRLLVLDEPTTGLDVVTQAHILDEIKRCTPSTGCRWSTSRTTWPCRRMSPTASRSCTAGGSSRRAPAEAVLQELAPSIHARAARRGAGPPDGAAAARDPGRGRRRRRPARRAAPTRRAARSRTERRCGASSRRARRSSPGHSRPLLRVAAASRRATPLRRRPRVRAATRSRRRSSAVEELEAVHRSHHDRVTAAAGRLVRRRAGASASALVGESGSGKTTIARCVVGLHQPTRRPDPARRRAARRRGRRTGPASSAAAARSSSRTPYESLNPLRRVGDQVAARGTLLRGLGREGGAGGGAAPARARPPARAHGRPLPARALRRRAPARRDRPRARRRSPT